MQASVALLKLLTFAGSSVDSVDIAEEVFGVQLPSFTYAAVLNIPVVAWVRLLTLKLLAYSDVESELLLLFVAFVSFGFMAENSDDVINGVSVVAFVLLSVALVRSIIVVFPGSL
jgi:hypothetical protein